MRNYKMKWVRRLASQRKQGTAARMSPTRTTHATPPEKGDLSEEAVAKMLGNIDSDYQAKVKQMGDQLLAKVVSDSAGGHSGYILRFTDGQWVAVWLDLSSSRMEFLVGEGDPDANVVGRLADPSVADASSPLDIDRIYASEPNDIAAEARHTHEKPIVGVGIGERAFSLCFPGGMELEGSVFSNAAGRLMMRVFWEQW